MASLISTAMVAVVCGGLSAATAGCSSDSDNSGRTPLGSAGAASGTGGSGTGTGGTTPGTGGGSSGGAFSAGVPGDTVVDDMTPAEWETMCEAATAYMEAGMMDVTCLMSGLMAAAMSMMNPDVTDAELQAACSEGYDACLAEPGSTGDCTPPDGSCTATVAELEACLTDSMAQVDAMVADMPACDDITAASLATMQEPADPGDPASCTALEQTCPGFL